MTKSLIEADGSFVGAYGDDTPVPPELMTPGRVVIQGAPDHAAKKWTGAAWGGAIPVAPVALTIDQLAAALVKKGGLSQADVDAAKANGTKP